MRRDGVKFVAEDSTWLMLRGSGTEPVLRIYAEAKSDADVQKLIEAGPLAAARLKAKAENFRESNQW